MISYNFLRSNVGAEEPSAVGSSSNDLSTHIGVMARSSRSDCDVTSRRDSGSSGEDRAELGGDVIADTVTSSSSSKSTGFLSEPSRGMNLVSVENHFGFVMTTGFVDFLADLGEILFLGNDRDVLDRVVGDHGARDTCQVTDNSVQDISVVA